MRGQSGNAELSAHCEGEVTLLSFGASLGGYATALRAFLRHSLAFLRNLSLRGSHSQLFES